MIANGAETKKWAKCSKETVYYNTIKRDHFNNLYIAVAPRKILKVKNIEKKALSEHETVEFYDIPGTLIQDYCSPDGNFLFVVSIDGIISLFDNKGTLIETIDLELAQEEDVKAMTVSPCCEYIAVAYWEKEDYNSSIYFIRINNPDFFNKYKTPSRMKTPILQQNNESMFRIINNFDFGFHYPKLKKNVNSFFLSLSLDSVVNQYPILTAIQLFNEKKVFGFILNGDDVIPTEHGYLEGDKAVVNSYYYNGEVYCVDNELTLSKVKFFIK